jgi:hypothetical protein
VRVVGERRFLPMDRAWLALPAATDSFQSSQTTTGRSLFAAGPE